MAIDSAIKKNWIEIQKRHATPVNAIGIKIDPKDEKTLKTYLEEDDLTEQAAKIVQYALYTVYVV